MRHDLALVLLGAVLGNVVPTVIAVILHEWNLRRVSRA